MVLALTIIGLVLAFIALFLYQEEIRKYFPFLPKPLIKITYQRVSDGSAVTVCFENIGNRPAEYITVDIRSDLDFANFSVGEIHSEFELSASGQGGSWTVLTGKNVIPQQKGSVILRNVDGPNTRLVLNPPKVKSDSRYTLVEVEFGPWEWHEANNNK